MMGSMELTPADREWIEQRAVAAGFDLAGVAAVPTPASEEAALSDERFAAWLAAGYGGEIEYLRDTDGEGKLLRGDVQRSLPWARSVVVCAMNYNVDAPLSTDAAPASAGWIARYAWAGKPNVTEYKQTYPATYPGSDYHDVLLPRLEWLEAKLRERFAGIETRCYVDTGPIAERDYAARAGVGWIGRNTCVIHQKQGSWLLLGIVVTSLPLAPQAASLPAADRCGSCTRCIDACPTGALLAEDESGFRQMDASRCIAYLTIEKKGSLAEELRAAMGRQVFGCDICQDVCPWNARAPVSVESPLPPRRELINPALGWLAALEGQAYNRMFRQSPLERSGRRRLHRNVAIAMGNSGEATFVPQLEAWSGSDDEVLVESAQWALARLRGEIP